MSDKYRNKYRNASARAQWWNYGQAGAYFVTICTQHRKPFFGEIRAGEMKPSAIGAIAEQEWWKTLDIRMDMNLQRGEFVVMPNHIHGIIIIGKNQYNAKIDTEPGRNAMHGVPTPRNKFGPQSKNLASIIRGFKSAVTQRARLIQVNFAWQPRFHDRIIRDHDEYQRIAHYIITNPTRWNEDTFYPE